MKDRRCLTRAKMAQLAGFPFLKFYYNMRLFFGESTGQKSHILSYVSMFVALSSFEPKSLIF